ncbi:MAG: polyphosphate kinase 2 [Pseudomonadota bacterium]
MAKKHKKSAAAEPAGKSRDNRPGKLSSKGYEEELEKLQGELVKLQLWVKEKGVKVIVIFEGRDAAGKGGVIKRITERVSPRVFKVVALPAPTEREKTQLYIQRYLSHFPAAGEIVLFDRSWYNRAGVERVMGFCTDHEYERFLRMTPAFERVLLDNDIILIKYWFDVSMDEQQRRFQDRIDDDRKIWKLSPMDTESYHRWYDYSRARDAMFESTDTDFAPWYIVPSDDKKRARLNCISHLLGQIPYKELPRKKIKLGKRNLKDKYDDEASLKGRRFITEKY